MNPTPILTPEAKLESLINLDTGQMSHSAFHTPVRPHYKDACSNTSLRKDAMHDTASAENSKFLQTDPRGFDVDASATADAVTNNGVHTPTPRLEDAALGMATACAGM